MAFTILSYLFRCVSLSFLFCFVHSIDSPFCFLGIIPLVYAWKSNASESVSSLSVDVCLCMCRFHLHAFDSFTLFQTNGDALFAHNDGGFGLKHTQLILSAFIIHFLCVLFFRCFFLVPFYRSLIETNAAELSLSPTHFVTNKYSFDAILCHILYVSIVRWKMLIERKNGKGKK